MSDYMLAVEAWSSNDGLADVDGDGVVTILDLLAILAGFGPCE